MFGYVFSAKSILLEGLKTSLVELGRDINQIYIYELLKNFSLSLIGVFVPIYIVSQGLTLFHAALFIVLSGVTGIILSYPVARIISRFGFKHGLVASYFLIIPGLIAIRSFKLSLAVIIGSSLLYNLGRITHNISLNSEFAVDSKKKTRGKDSGRMLSLPNISRVIAPLFGGVIFASLGFDSLVVVALVFLVLSIVPLLFSGDHRDPMDYSFRDVFKEEHLTTVPLFVIRGIQAVTAVSVFSLFIYFSIGGALDVGWARAMDSLGFVLTGLVTGKFIQRYSERYAVIIGTSGAALIHVFRSLVATPVHAFMVSFIGGIFFQIYHVPIYKKFAERAEKEDVLEFYTLRKMFVSVGNILTIGVLAGSYMFFSREVAFGLAFVLAALATVSMRYFSERIPAS